jgi:hypothetical protein
MLSKGMKYFYDAEAVKEPQSEGTFRRYGNDPKIPPKRKWSEDSDKGGSSKTHMQEHIENSSGEMVAILPNGRNRRSVWFLPTQPYKGAHFATFPEKLVEPCILAGTSGKGACPRCGAPWRRISQNSGTGPQRNHRKNSQIRLTRLAGQAWEKWKARNPNLDMGWRPGCICNTDDLVPSVVLDPFMGSGTVGVVAARLGRNFIGVDLKPEYVGMAAQRMQGVGGVKITCAVCRPGP